MSTKNVYTPSLDALSTKFAYATVKKEEWEQSRKEASDLLLANYAPHKVGDTLMVPDFPNNQYRGQVGIITGLSTGIVNGSPMLYVEMELGRDTSNVKHTVFHVPFNLLAPE